MVPTARATRLLPNAAERIGARVTAAVMVCAPHLSHRLSPFPLPAPPPFRLPTAQGVCRHRASQRDGVPPDPAPLPDDDLRLGRSPGQEPVLVSLDSPLPRFPASLHASPNCQPCALSPTSAPIEYGETGVLPAVLIATWVTEDGTGHFRGRARRENTAHRSPLVLLQNPYRPRTRARPLPRYFLKRLKRIKKSNGEIISVGIRSEKRPGTIKNYAIALRYDSRSGTHNMYREYRELSKADAVTACYSEMASRHRVRSRSLQIVSVDAIQAKVRTIAVFASAVCPGCLVWPFDLLGRDVCVWGGGFVISPALVALHRARRRAGPRVHRAR